MASSGNFPVLNILYRGQRGTSSNYYGTITQGNTRIHSSSSSDALQISTVENLKTGKWYWEWCLRDNQGDQLMHSGAADSNRANWDYAAAAATYGAEQSIHFHTYFQIVEKNGSDTGAYSSSGSSHSVDDVFGIALDTDNGKFYVHKNGTYYASGNPATGANPGATWTPASEYTDGFTPYFTASGGTNADGVLNFGQDSTFGGAISAGGNTDQNGFGDFKYSPPSGFLAVCSANLPISDDIDPAQTDDDIPTKQFGIGLYTGQSGGGNSVVCGFQPDLIWGKLRSGSQTGILIDSSRGQGLLFSATTDDEQTSNGPFISSYNTDGFTFASSGSNPNDNGATYVAWCWRANGGTTASNSNGAISSTVQANQAAGFSIVQWTANATSSVATTVGHGLSKAPEFVITKSRDSSGNWCATHTGLSSTSHMLFLNTDGAQTDKSGNGSMSANTSTVFSVNATDGSNSPNGDAMIAYCWHSVEGYSKFGSYTGNSNNDGPFIYTGFRPRMVFLKLRDSAGDWWIYDSARDTANPVNKYISWNRTDAEASGLNADFLSNGFKLRNTSGDFNSSATILYGAWGDVPWKYNNTF